MTDRHKGHAGQMGLLAPSLAQTQIPIDSVSEHPDNSNIGDVAFIVESIKAHGMYKPIVVQAKTRYICAGNHTWRACKEAGLETIAAVELDITDEQALAILEMDNEASRRAKFDQARRALNLKRLQASGELETLPLFAEAIMSELEVMEGAQVSEAQEFQGDYAESAEDHAARVAHLPLESSSMAQGFKEVVLMFKQGDWERFLHTAGAIKTETGLPSNTDVVVLAMSSSWPELWEAGGSGSGASTLPEPSLASPADALVVPDEEEIAALAVGEPPADEEVVP